MNDNFVCIGVAPASTAERLKSLLRERDVKIETFHNSSTCQKGCSMTVEIWIEKNDLPILEEVMTKEKARTLEGLDFDPEVVNEVFDPEKESAVCPACGTSFSTKNTECPECGLCFG